MLLKTIFIKYDKTIRKYFKVLQYMTIHLSTCKEMADNKRYFIHTPQK